MQIALDELEPHLARRIGVMLELGALEEAKAAYEKCSDPEAPGWTGIGCAELLAFLRNEISLDEARRLWVKNTRAYAKRQITWFRKEADIQWFHRARMRPLPTAFRRGSRKISLWLSAPIAQE